MEREARNANACQYCGSAEREAVRLIRKKSKQTAYECEAFKMPASCSGSRHEDGARSAECECLSVFTT